MNDLKLSENELSVTSVSAAHTLELGSLLGGILEKGDFVALVGGLGSGKTQFTKGIAKGLGVPGYDYVNSPSFVILKIHKGRLPLYHFDLYRLEEKDVLETIDCERYFFGYGISVCEWADRIADLIPEKRVTVLFEHAGKNIRRLKICFEGERYKKTCKTFCEKIEKVLNK